MTTISFAEYLNQTRPSAAAVQQAARLYIGEITDDLPADQLRAEVVSAAKDAALVEKVFADLQKDPETTDAIFLDFLANEWQDPDKQAKIRSAFEAPAQAPVIETIIIASCALYAIYCVAYVVSGAGVKESRNIKRNPDGSVEETVTKEHKPPATPTSAVGSLFSTITKWLPGTG